MLDGIRVFDAHTHILGRFKPRDESLIDYLDRYRIDKAITMSLNQAASLNVIIGTKENTQTDQFTHGFEQKAQLDHTPVLKLVKENPDRLYGVYWFNPKVADDEQWAELEKYVTEHGFVGVKTQACVDLLKIPDDFHELAEFCIEQNIPLYLHSSAGFFFQSAYRAKDIRRLIRKHKDLKLIIGHAAYTMEYCINLIRYFSNYKNVYFETSQSIPYGIYTLIKAMGKERVIFGSDAPPATTPDIEMRKIEILNLDKSTLEHVFHKNIESLITK